jgi:hypothetical protein
MFVFDRSAFAVVIPLALLVAVVLWSNRGTPPVETQPASASHDAHSDQALAANLPSR